jgi:hypothetical protein
MRRHCRFQNAPAYANLLRQGYRGREATEVKRLRRAGIVEWEKQTEEMGDGGKFQISDCRLEAFPPTPLGRDRHGGASRHRNIIDIVPLGPACNAGLSEHVPVKLKVLSFLPHPSVVKYFLQNVGFLF